ncbi:hypothetical protein FBQ97_12480 [Acidobacteria bacterium ACD]|nr:MAG: hypothetical protein EDX89_07920 [Acidobacteriota bacterium]MCE7958434.1 hypothetical protein [Acidobacteria bacterium ACB2]MDL1950613.1 hypothetical protein [Acidobacteria bacterium ACD]
MKSGADDEPATIAAPGSAAVARAPRALVFLSVAHVVVGLLHVLVLAPLLLLIVGLASAGSHQGWQGPPPIARAAPLLLYGIASVAAGLGLCARRRGLVLPAAVLALFLPAFLAVATDLYRPPAVPGVVTPLQRVHSDFVVFARDVPWLPLAWLATIAALLIVSSKRLAAR